MYPLTKQSRLLHAVKKGDQDKAVEIAWAHKQWTVQNYNDAMWAAARHEHWDIMKMFDRKIPRPYSSNIEILIDAAANNKPEQARQILASRRVSVHTLCDIRSLDIDLPCRLRHVDALYVAARAGHLDMVTLLLDHDRKKEKCANAGKALLGAMEGGHEPVIALLMQEDVRLTTENYLPVPYKDRRNRFTFEDSLQGVVTDTLRLAIQRDDGARLLKQILKQMCQDAGEIGWINPDIQKLLAETAGNGRKDAVRVLAEESLFKYVTDQTQGSVYKGKYGDEFVKKMLARRLDPAIKQAREKGHEDIAAYLTDCKEGKISWDALRPRGHRSPWVHRQPQ